MLQVIEKSSSAIAPFPVPVVKSVFDVELTLLITIIHTAKMGLVGFSNTVAKEGERHNVTCNALAPSAWSRMTASLMPPGTGSLSACLSVIRPSLCLWIRGLLLVLWYGSCSLSLTHSPSSTHQPSHYLLSLSEFEELLKAEDLAPVVAYLCHESCRENGTIIEVYNNLYLANGFQLLSMLIICLNCRVLEGGLEKVLRKTL